LRKHVVDAIRFDSFDCFKIFKYLIAHNFPYNHDEVVNKIRDSLTYMTPPLCGQTFS